MDSSFRSPHQPPALVLDHSRLDCTSIYIEIASTSPRKFASGTPCSIAQRKKGARVGP
jgi:hypothetical protein